MWKSAILYLWEQNVFQMIYLMIIDIDATDALDKQVIDHNLWRVHPI